MPPVTAAGVETRLARHRHRKHTDGPISVTGARFEGVGPRRPCFRCLKALYDLVSRVSVDVFEVARLSEERPIGNLVRRHPAVKLLPLNAEAGVIRAEAASGSSASGHP